MNLNNEHPPTSYSEHLNQREMNGATGQRNHEFPLNTCNKHPDSLNIEIDLVKVETVCRRREEGGISLAVSQSLF